MKILFIGNPGTGKSTLLNGIIGQAKFKSGVSFGKGMTQFIQLCKDEKTGIEYGDTPGLSDVELREQAAAEITKALKSGDDEYKIVFVVTEEAGRVRPADVATMTCVLDSISGITDMPPYGIIVNKVSKKKIQRMTSNPHESSAFTTCLNDKYVTTYITLYEHKFDLEDEDDKVHQVSTDLLEFLSVLPSIRIEPHNVQDVKVDQYQAIIDDMEKQITKLLRDNRKMQDKMMENQQRHEENLRQYQDKVNEKLKAKEREMNRLCCELDNVKWENTKQAKEATFAMQKAQRDFEDLEKTKRALEEQQNQIKQKKSEGGVLKFLSFLLPIALGMGPLMDPPC